MSIARRSIASIGWNIIVSVVQVVVGFVRFALLARLLPVKVFGVYGMAGSIVGLSVVVANFGMASAFLHRAPETEDEEEAAAVFFTLKMIFISIWAVLLTGFAVTVTRGQDRTALLLLTLTRVGIQLAETPRMILIRRVVHRRLALLQLVDILITAIVAISLAWNGVELWTLLSTDIVTVVLTIIFLYVWRPVWKPRLVWSPPAMRYFLRFGSRSLIAAALLRAVDQIDDLWAGAYLGKTPLGFYSRAYTFATYPRTILAASINKVAGGTYAELKTDRLRLSQAFFRTNAFLVRSGFYFAGLLALLAPELIRLVIGAKWLPMLDAFRLMLVFTLLDPIKITIGDLFIAVGRPEQIAKARFLQLLVLLSGLFLMGPALGIAGVALAVDIMLVAGMAILLWQARSFVDFSLRRLFAAPGLSLLLGMLLARGAIMLPGVLGSDWRTGIVKTTVFTVVYGTVWFFLERRQVLEMMSALNHHLSVNLKIR